MSERLLDVTGLTAGYGQIEVQNVPPLVASLPRISNPPAGNCTSKSTTFPVINVTPASRRDAARMRSLMNDFGMLRRSRRLRFDICATAVPAAAHAEWLGVITRLTRISGRAMCSSTWRALAGASVPARSS